MRDPADAEAVRRFAAALGRVAPDGTRLYLTGGATAVFEGWRATTMDVDLLIEPESDIVMRRLSELKNELGINVETASPLDFLPELPGWRDRCRSRFRTGSIEVFDFDPYSQALSKIERGFELDRADVAAMLAGGLVKPERLRELHAEIEDQLYRFPAVDPEALREKLDRAL